MAAKKKKSKAAKKPAKKASTAPDSPQMFRVSLHVADIDAAAAFYGKLFGVQPHKSPGSRIFVEAGPVSLMIVATGPNPHAAPKSLYFTLNKLEPTFARAQELNCLSQDDVHDKPGGGIVVRPWGERSFYVEDPWKNPLCFVEAGTIYPS